MTEVLQRALALVASAALASAPAIFLQLCDLPADAHYSCRQIEGVKLRVQSYSLLQGKVNVSRCNRSYPQPSEVRASSFFYPNIKVVSILFHYPYVSPI